MSDSAHEWRVQFDAEVSFTNGGRLRAEGFKLDSPGTDVSDKELGELFVRHLGLLMVGEVRISNKQMLAEPHKGSRDVAPPSSTKRRIIELSHVIHHGLVTYPGLPAPEISDHLTRDASSSFYSEGTQFQIGRISMVANTGTYLDTPFHRFEGRADLASAPLSSMADLEAIVVRVNDSHSRAIDRATLLPFEVREKAVLLQTGWDRHWATESYAVGAPFLTGEAAGWLAEQGAVLVGIDSINIDDMSDKSRPAHTKLLDAGVLIVEHMCNLDMLPTSGFRFFATPPRIDGMGTFPVRAFALIESSQPG